MNRKLVAGLLILLLSTLFVPFGFSQEAESLENLEMTNLVNCPTAGVLERGQYSLQLRTYGEGGVIAGVAMGLFDRFMFGVSFGGNSLLGYEEPTWNELPGVVIKYRVIDESMALPAITIGFDMQGTGQWYEAEERYLQKSSGFFAVASRNFVSSFGRFGIHGGVNLNSIEDQLENSVDGFAGVDFDLNEQLTLVAEYDLALDDRQEENPVERFGTGLGYLNLGARFTFMRSLAIELLFTDFLNNSSETSGIGRELRVTYVEAFSF